ncbi:XRE family transcriptional regulator [Nocardia africana]
MAIKYLSRAGVAERIGVKYDTLNRYKLPPHDAEVGDRKGWLPQTIDEWNERRPGRGQVKNKRWNLPPDLQ